MRIVKKSALVELLAGAQVLCLAMALIGFAFWIRGSVQGVVRRQILGDNQQIAAQMGKLIDGKELGSIEYGSRNWEFLQSLIEEVSLPNQGYMCIADDETGKLLCHPDIRSKPALRDLNVGASIISLDGHASTILEAAKRPSRADHGGIRTGIVGQGNRTEVVSAAHLPSIHAVLLVHQSEASTRTAVGRILLPIGVIGLIVGCALILVTSKTSVAILNRYENKLAEVNDGLEQTVRDRTQALLQTRDAVIFGLAKLSESRDSDTGEHLDRIRVYVTLLSKEYAESVGNLDHQFLNDIGLASSLHDIGKVGIPDAVLLKPGKLEASERRLMELHPRIGSACLAAIEARLGENGFLNLASEICAFHHEKWDGTGYPYGVAGASIPLSARIVAIADVYDALRSRRPYKEPLSHERACQFIEQGRGSHFDPQLVDAFLRIESEFRAASAAFSSQQSSEAINGAGNRLPNASASSVVYSSVLTVRTSQSRRSKDIPMDLARA